MGDIYFEKDNVLEPQFKRKFFWIKTGKAIDHLAHVIGYENFTHGPFNLILKKCSKIIRPCMA